MQKIPVGLLLILATTLGFGGPLFAAGSGHHTSRTAHRAGAIPVAENGEDGIRTHRDRMWRDRRDQDEDARWREDQRKFRPMPAPETVREPGNSRIGSRGSPEAVYRLARGSTRIEIRCPPAVLERCVKAGNQLIREVLTEPDVAAPDGEPRGKPAPEPGNEPAHMPEGGS